MIRQWYLLLMAVCLACTSGCGTWAIYDRNTLMREQSDRENMRAELVPIKERMEAIEADKQQLQGKVDELQRSLQEQARRTEERLTQTEQRIEAARATDKKEIIDQLSRNMADIMARQQQSSRPSQATPGTHTVQPGETISQIAARYQVKVEAIAEANQLKDPNSIRTGQKLIIPK